MRILQVGLPKCGNYWLYKILDGVMAEAGLPRESYIKKLPVHAAMQDWLLSFPEQKDIDQVDVKRSIYVLHVVNAFRMPIADLDAFVNQTNFVWTHSAYNELFARMIPKFDKTVYIIRDPRDRVLSLARWVMLDYYQFYTPTVEKSSEEYLEVHLERLMKQWKSHILGFLNVAKEHNIHIIFYENLLNDFQAELARLLQYLELDLSQEQCEKIETDTSFETMKQKSPGHLNKGGQYRWFDKLSPQHIATTEQICGDLITALNYPHTIDDRENLPGLNAINDGVLASLQDTPQQIPLKERIKTRIIRLVESL